MVSAVENRTFSDQRTFSEIKRLSSAGLSGPELLHRASERLRRSVPFEASCVATVDPASFLMTRVVNGGSVSEEERSPHHHAVLERTYFEEDLPRISEMVREGRHATLLSEATGGDLVRSARYREYLKPLGLGHELGSVFVHGGLWGAGYFTREAGDTNFGAREVALMKRIAPHLGAGLKAAALGERATTQQLADDTPGVLTLDPLGNVVSHTPSAEHWLTDLEELDPAWREGVLPVAVRMLREVLRQSLDPASDRDQDLVPRVQLRARSGRWLALYGSLTEPSDARPSETVVVVEPAKPGEVARLNVAAYGLSPREKEVIELIVQGLSNREISRSLFISENTVQRHLSNIFEKVGVRGRNGLLKHLFLENVMPGMAG